jgi:hypothetical protein
MDPNMRLLAIDPGNIDSAYVIFDTADLRPIEFGKVPNFAVLDVAADFTGPLAIEMIASYGMPVGVEVFETCVWVGRFIQAHNAADGAAELIYRKPVKRHFCGTDQAKDPNVVQALRDRFAPGQPNYGKGTKADPGWFYGFAADVWQAYAVGVYFADTRYPAKDPL